MYLLNHNAHLSLGMESQETGIIIVWKARKLIIVIVWTARKLITIFIELRGRDVVFLIGPLSVNHKAWSFFHRILGCAETLASSVICLV